MFFTLNRYSTRRPVSVRADSSSERCNIHKPTHSATLLIVQCNATIYIRQLRTPTRYSFFLFFFFFPSHVLSSPFSSLSLLYTCSRNSDLGSHSRLFSPTPYGSCLAFFCREMISALYSLVDVLKALVHWATGERLTNRLPKLILI